ncbi:50S ribosomal protein L9 [bacterium]|nr:50S ribosomal protein L9 [bacterium]
MEVILFESVPNLGLQGSIVPVKAGYYRNFLGPRGLAVEATRANVKRLQDKMKQLEKQAQEEQKAARSEAQKLEEVALTFQLKAGQEDKLFGSVTNQMIAEKLAEAGYEIDRHRISLPEPIRRLGVFTVDIRLHHEVWASVKVLVEKEETPGQSEPAQEETTEPEKAE